MDKKNSRVKIVKIEVHFGHCQSTAWTESNYNTSACANFLDNRWRLSSGNKPDNSKTKPLRSPD